MVENSSGSPQSDLDRWLASLGFSRGNPFGTVEADRERALLPEFFVDVDGYERIKGDRSVVCFAPRGGGKSALRVVLASHAAPNSPEATSLAIEYTNFDVLISRHRAGHDVTVADHAPLLLKAGLQALLDTLCGDLKGEQAEEAALATQHRRANRARWLLAPTRSRLAHALRHYAPDVLDAEPLYERLHFLDAAFAPGWWEFCDAVTKHRLRELVEASPLARDEIACLLADLNDYPVSPGKQAAMPIEEIISFVRLVFAAGLSTVQILVDRLDEVEETANDPQAQADLLEPLLAHLPMMEIPGVPFKFFLSYEVRDVLLARQAIRRDRITDHAVTVRWDEAKLKRLLDERLSVYSNGLVHDLSLLWQDSRDGERVEAEMLQCARGSPRYLLIAGELLCEAHIARRGPTGLFEPIDWVEANTALMQKIPHPIIPLSLRRGAHVARIGQMEIKLSKLDYRILHTLAQAGGECDRETLIDEAWEIKADAAGKRSGISDAAVDQAIKRLRWKLGDDADRPTYLMTLPDHGFRLLNFQIDSTSR